MAFKPLPGEQYTIRRKVLKIFGAAFHIYDERGLVIGFCKQKAFRLREDIRVYTDESLAKPLLSLQARQVIDFGVTFDVRLADGSPLGTIRRKGLKSLLRDSWLVFNAAGAQVATLEEDGAFLAIMRRAHEAVSLFFPQKFHLVRSDGAKVAAFRQHFNPFVYRLGISITPGFQDDDIDDMMILSLGCLIAAVEGRQSG